MPTFTAVGILVGHEYGFSDGLVAAGLAGGLVLLAPVAAKAAARGAKKAAAKTSS